MNRFFKVVLAGFAAVAAGIGIMGTSAHAQTSTLPVQYPWSVKAGIAFPSSSRIGNSFDAGLSYDFKKTTADSPVIYSIYGDYYGKSSANLLGYGVSATFLLGQAVAQSKPYVGVGIGGDTSKVQGSSTKTNLGGKVFAGYDFTQNVFAEVDYSITSSNNGANPDALGLRVGYRF